MSCDYVENLRDDIARQEALIAFYRSTKDDKYHGEIMIHLKMYVDLKDQLRQILYETKVDDSKGSL